MKKQIITLMTIFFMFGVAPLCVLNAATNETVLTNQQTEEEGEVKKAKSDLAILGIAISAALVMGLCAIATGIAQSRIGAAACGTIAERPEVSGTLIILLAIPETMVILGFVVAIIILFVL